MSSRKSHSKSRKGCLPCKRRHVKCDEQGPPCANCIVRHTACTYSAAAAAPASVSPPPSRSPVPPLPDSDDARRRLLELELMHRWTATTYQSLCGIDEERHLMQVVMPRAGLTYGYLLDGLLAVAALDLAVELQGGEPPGEGAGGEEMEVDGEGEGAIKDLEREREREEKRERERQYARAALEYYARSLGEYQAALAGAITADNYLPMFIYSLLVALISVVLPQCEGAAGVGDGGGDGQPTTMLESVVLLFELMNGNVNLAVASWEFIKTGPLRLDVFEAVPPLQLLDEETRAAMGRLRALNDSANPPTPTPQPPPSAALPSLPETPSEPAEATATTPAVPSPQPPSPHQLYEKAITELEGIFARDAGGKVKGVCIAWPGLAGRPFTAAARRSEPMALVVLMHWGVLMARLGRDTWWAARGGVGIVAELSVGLFRSQLSPAPELREAIAWAREQAGLEGLS